MPVVWVVEDHGAAGPGRLGGTWFRGLYLAYEYLVGSDLPKGDFSATVRVKVEGQEVGSMPSKAVPHTKSTNLLGLVPATFSHHVKSRGRTGQDMLIQLTGETEDRDNRSSEAGR